MNTVLYILYTIHHLVMNSFNSLVERTVLNECLCITEPKWLVGCVICVCDVFRITKLPNDIFLRTYAHHNVCMALGYISHKTVVKIT